MVNRSSLYNNVIVGSSTAGVQASNGSRLSVTSSVLLDNAIGSYTVIDSVVSSTYNNYFGNGTATYCALTSCNCCACFCASTVTSFNDTVTTDPHFVGGSDFHLQIGSPCIDAGNPTSSDNDPDGTRNDQGVYGGLGSAPFFPRPGTPVVQSLSVTPHDVVVGGTLRIRATGKAQQ